MKSSRVSTKEQMTLLDRTPNRGRLVAQQLKRLGVRGVLISAATQGYITELACRMPQCLCPEEIGGRRYFEGVASDLSDWMPTADHFPKLKKDGGHRIVDNVRLAHRLCNRVDYSKQIGRPYDRDLARAEAARHLDARDPREEASVWTVLVWNMGLGSPGPREAESSWDRLTALMEEQSVDVALLNEVGTSLLAGVEGAVYEPWGTRGRDLRPRPWSTAVVSRHGCTQIVDARAKSPSRSGRRPNVRFESSRPGSWAAAVVPVPAVGTVTCVSLYGLMDELSEASLHRSLCEISPLFSDPRYKELLLLGGDLNTSTQWPAGPHLDGDATVLARIKAYGLIDCLEEMREPGRTPECTCTFGDDCSHTWTRFDSKHPGLQVDYLFASPALAARLRSCVALSPLDWRHHSDHAPIIAVFA